MNKVFDQIAYSLSSHGKQIRSDTIKRLIREGDPETLSFVLNLLKQTAVPNGYPLIIHAMGKSRNPIYTDALLNVEYKNYELTINALIKLGVFDQYACFFLSRKDMKMKLRYAAKFISPRLILELCQVGKLDDILKAKSLYAAIWKVMVAKANF
ncbi:hypothetical protein [Dyadobacter luticola]|uniref:Uncharacterized protein n=1 Tax=Dyadobacter luticola TaxID=1979387 RepID=A0A5R9KUZ3_9BACT|nr:hypothetical protein [Dyadobacter luticola]TLU99964.1 hypothetical protein FEN17_10635 [Dyadobacter luticola]